MFFYQVVQEMHVQLSEMSDRCNELISQNKVNMSVIWQVSSYMHTISVHKPSSYSPRSLRTKWNNSVKRIAI